MIVALLPVIAVLVTRAGRTYFPVNDRASIDLMVRDVFSGHPPLVGTYSRGFNHPGPLLFWVLAPLTALAGGAPWATLVGSALLQGVGIVAVAWISFRRGGTAFMLVMLATLGLAYTGLAAGQASSSRGTPSPRSRSSCSSSSRCGRSRPAIGGRRSAR